MVPRGAAAWQPGAGRGKRGRLPASARLGRMRCCGATAHGAGSSSRRAEAAQRFLCCFLQALVVRAVHAGRQQPTCPQRSGGSCGATCSSGRSRRRRAADDAAGCRGSPGPHAFLRLTEMGAAPATRAPVARVRARRSYARCCGGVGAVGTA